MDELEKGKTVSGKLSRRSFLKLSGGLVASAALNPVINIFTPKEAGIREQQWTREEVFQRPVEFVDYFCDKMVDGLGMDNLSEDQKALLDAMSTKYSNYGEERTKYIRDNLERGYQLYGGIINDIVDNTQVYGEGYKEFLENSFLAITPFFRPLLHMYDSLCGDEPVSYDISHTDYADLITTPASRLNIAVGESGYANQKASFVSMAEREYDDYGFEVVFNTSSEPGGREYTEEEKEDFREMVEVCRKGLPLIFGHLRKMTVETTYRSHFMDYDTTSEIVLGSDVFNSMLYVISDYKKYRDMDLSNLPENVSLENLLYYSQLSVDGFLTILIHELGHKEDLWRNPTNTMYYHPEDLLGYALEHTKMYKDFFDFLDGNDGRGELTPQDIEQWFLDPITPKTFGIDQMRDMDDVSAFQGEMNLLYMLVDYLETNAPKDFLKNTGFDYFFKESGDDLINWKVRANIFDKNSGTWNYLNIFYNNDLNALQNSPASLGGDITSSFTSFKGISKTHIEEMLQVVDQVHNSEDLQNKDYFFSAILQMKSLYLFAAYALVRRGVREGVLPEDSRLQAFQRSVEPLILNHLNHCMVGPTGEYIPLAPGIPPTLHIEMHDLMETSVQAAESMRAETPEYFSRKSSDFINNFNRHMVSISDKRAKMWGADVNMGIEQGKESDVYKDISEKVVSGVFGLEDLFWPGFMPAY